MYARKSVKPSISLRNMSNLFSVNSQIVSKSGFLESGNKASPYFSRLLYGNNISIHSLIIYQNE